MLKLFKSLFVFVRTYFALLVVVAVFIWSAYVIATYRAQQTPADAIVIRLGHWQLEASVREGIDEMAREYRKTHPNVVVVQDAIPEGTYGQWVSTQLMGGTAPDIMQAGGMLPGNIWLSYFNRYFTPISRYVNAPNPHNAGTELADVPFRRTHKDGMKTAYIAEMQEYMTVPLSLFGVRIFYNKDLLKKLVGRDVAPRDYRDFLAVCEEIRHITNSVSGQPYIPIAGSAYHFGQWDGMMFSPLTYGVFRRADFNRDGFVGNDETYVAFKTGLLDFYYPPYALWLKMLREVTDYFQAGYTGLGRDEAVFLFAQQRAVFMTTGTWDARSLQEQAKGQFEVGIMDFPIPSRDDPVYGQVVEGRIYESPGGGFQFGVSRNSKHPEVAIDFLLFLASQKGNEKLNAIIGWIPAIVGTQLDPLLAAFEPHLEGIYGNSNFTLGGNTAVTWAQIYSLYQVNQLSFDDFAKQYTEFYLKNGLADFMEQQRDWRRGIQRNEQYLAGIRGRAILAANAAAAAPNPEQQSAAAVDAESAWVRYRAITSARQIWGELNHARQLDLVTKDKLPDGYVGPYEYSSNVLAQIRQRIRAEKTTEARP
jgi:raffinose/stachyose/melibiose transport system substrate-binding protein